MTNYVMVKQQRMFRKGLGSRKQVSNLRKNTTLFSLKQDMFLSREYRKIVAPQKFEILRTNIRPRNEALRAYMPILTSYFQ